MNDLRKAFKEDCPETIGETDTKFDNHNYIEWLEKQIEKMKCCDNCDHVEYFQGNQLSRDVCKNIRYKDTFSICDNWKRNKE